MQEAEWAASDGKHSSRWQVVVMGLRCKPHKRFQPPAILSIFVKVVVRLNSRSRVSLDIEWDALGDLPAIQIYHTKTCWGTAQPVLRLRRSYQFIQAALRPTTLRTEDTALQWRCWGCGQTAIRGSSRHDPRFAGECELRGTPGKVAWGDLQVG